MPVVWVRLPDVETDKNGRPKRCPYCQSSLLQRWGPGNHSPNTDPGAKPASYRYRCSQCERTFRHYPDPAGQKSFDNRVREVAGMIWALGVSTREVVDLLSSTGIRLSRMTVWREGQTVQDRLENGRARGLRRFSIDRHYIHRVSSRLGVVAAVDFGRKRTIVLGTLDETNPQVVKAWMDELISDVEIEIDVQNTSTLDGCLSPGLT